MPRHRTATLVACLLAVLVPVTSAREQISELCKLADCTLEALKTCTKTPLITEVTAYDGVVPGGLIIVAGCGFGNKEGQISLSGLRTWSGMKLAPVKLTIPKAGYGLDFWTPTVAVGFIPDNITQVMDQPVTIQIQTATGETSGAYKTNFMATRETALLPMCDVDPGFFPVTCGRDADLDVCQARVDPDDSLPDFTSLGGGCADKKSTLSGYHENWWCCTSTQTGTDRHVVEVKNGWILDSMQWSRFTSSGSDLVVNDPAPGFPEFPMGGGTAWKPIVTWQTNMDDYVGYDIYVYITGPKGVPWK